MAGLLWALSSVLDLGDLHLHNPALAPSKHSWLEDTLALHEHVMCAFLKLDNNSSVRQVILPILALETNFSDWETMCITMACLGGFCEGLCVTRDNTFIGEVTDLFNKAIDMCNDEDGGPAGSREKLKCSLAASIARVYEWIGRGIDRSDSLLECALETLLEFAFDTDIISRDPFSARSTGVPKGAWQNRLLINATWSMANIITDLAATVDLERMNLALERITAFTTRLSDGFYAYMNNMKNVSNGWIPGESSADTLKRIFLVLLTLLSACFYKLGPEQSEGPTDKPPDDHSLFKQTRDFIRGRRPCLDHAEGKTMRALRVLESLGNLQFCRVNNPQHVQLIGDALEGLMEGWHSEVLFVSLFPDVDSIMVPTETNRAGSLKENALVISKTMFFMRLIPIGLGVSRHEENLGNEGSVRSTRLIFCIEQLAPYAFLLLQNQDPGVRKSGQQFFHALLTHLPTSSASDMAEKLTPYYIDRCLEKLHLLQPDDFGLCLQKLATLLPSNGISLKYCLERLQRDVLDLFHREQRGNVLVLFEIICKCVLWFPLSTVNDTLQTVEEIVHFEGGKATIPILYKVISTNKDYTTQLQLARFYLKVRYSMPGTQPGHRASM